MSLLSFAAGFVSGWVVRSTVESSRDLAVKLVRGFDAVSKRAESVLVAEREFLEDLWAEVASARRRDEASPDDDTRGESGTEAVYTSPTRAAPSHNGVVAS